MQAICNNNLRFSHISCVCPGSVHDSYARYCTSLGKALLSGLPAQYFVAGDEAYPMSGSIISRYPGAVSSDIYKDSFNYYLSRCRVRIENAFALLVGKWGSLWRPLRIPLLKIPTYLIAIGRLHNIGVDLDQDNTEDNFEIYEAASRGKFEFHDTHVPTPSYLDHFELGGDERTNALLSREWMRGYLEENGIVKPNYAIRNRI